MVAKNVGKIGSDYYWHRFALPVDKVNAEDGTWAKDGHSYGTLLYKWDYENNEWASLTNVNQMQPFYGYTMTINEEVAGPGDLKDAGYIFKGKLTGNVNSVLNFSRQGYNFFGNSYLVRSIFIRESGLKSGLPFSFFWESKAYRCLAS